MDLIFRALRVNQELLEVQAQKALLEALVYQEPVDQEEMLVLRSVLSVHNMTHFPLWF